MGLVLASLGRDDSAGVYSAGEGLAIVLDLSNF